jgi:hypothetical protein
MLKLEYVRSPTVQVRPGFEFKKAKLKLAVVVPLPVHTETACAGAVPTKESVSAAKSSPAAVLSYFTIVKNFYPFHSSTTCQVLLLTLNVF